MPTFTCERFDCPNVVGVWRVTTCFDNTSTSEVTYFCSMHLREVLDVAIYAQEGAGHRLIQHVDSPIRNRFTVDAE